MKDNNVTYENENSFDSQEETDLNENSTVESETEKKTETQTETVTEPVQEEQPSAPQPAIRPMVQTAAKITDNTFFFILNSSLSL